MSKHILELRAGKLRLALRPDLGGAIAGLWMDGLPVLRSTEPDELATARTSGCYPLVPYSNRIGHRRFSWMGQEHSTLPNFDDNPHSVHGVAWQRPWDVAASSGSEAELVYHHAADGHWPFAFEVRQHAVLTSDALTLRLSVTNLASQTQPVGLGWHPYFPQREHSHLRINLQGRWDNDALGLPVQRVAQPPINHFVSQLGFDNCFDGWQGPAFIHDGQMALRLTSSLPYLVVFTPNTKPYYCVEPVSHVSNAIQMADPQLQGLQAVAPGATAQGWMKLDIAPA